MQSFSEYGFYEYEIGKGRICVTSIRSEICE